MAAVGSVDVEGAESMARDALFRIASVTKPIMAATLLTSTTAPWPWATRWLPALADPVVVRSPASAVEDVVPAERAVTVADLLSARAGWGHASDFSLPVVGMLTELLGPGSVLPQDALDVDQWLTALASTPA